MGNAQKPWDELFVLAYPLLELVDGDSDLCVPRDEKIEDALRPVRNILDEEIANWEKEGKGKDAQRKALLDVVGRDKGRRHRSAVVPGDHRGRAFVG